MYRVPRRRSRVRTAVTHARLIALPNGEHIPPPLLEADEIKRGAPAERSPMLVGHESRIRLMTPNAIRMVLCGGTTHSGGHPCAVLRF